MTCLVRLTNPPLNLVFLTRSIGDLLISLDRVVENSLLENTSLVNELHRVIFHGVLHLCGYKDKSKKDIGVMRFKESYYLYLFVPRETMSQ